MKILVTGAMGYCGSVLSEKLLIAGHEVIRWDTQWFGNPLPSDVDPVDVRKITSIPDNTDAIIHLAAISNDPSVSYYPRKSWETGVLATMQLCEVAIKVGCRRFIFASSVSVYGADRGEVTESMDLRPVSDYNKVKIAAERVLQSYNHDLDITIIRPATVCGLSPRMRTDLTVNMFCMQALERGIITLHGGDQWRPSIHIDDLTALYASLIVPDAPTGIFNAGFEDHTLRQIADRVRANIPCRIEVTEQRDARSYRVNSDKLLATGFAPKKKINDAIYEIWDAHKRGAVRDELQWNNLKWMRLMEINDD